MIARIWHGITSTSKADEYLVFLLRRAVPDYRGTPGNLAVQLLLRTEGEITHFMALTYWQSRESITAFTGSEISNAKYYPEDADFLLEFEATVQHFEVYQGF